MTQTPKVDSYGQKELKKAEAQVEKFNEDVKQASESPVNSSVKQEVIIDDLISPDKYFFLKPVKRIKSKEKFNETFRKQYEEASELIFFIAENIEQEGEKICKWTKAFPGIDAEYWEIPVNRIVKGPRYLCEEISACSYNQLMMEDRLTSQDKNMSYYGSLVVSKTKHRLNANEYFPGKQKSHFRISV